MEGGGADTLMPTRRTNLHPGRPRVPKTPSHPASTSDEPTAVDPGRSYSAVRRSLQSRHTAGRSGRSSAPLFPSFRRFRSGFQDGRSKASAQPRRHLKVDADIQSRCSRPPHGSTKIQHSSFIYDDLMISMISPASIRVVTIIQSRSSRMWVSLRSIRATFDVN